MKDIAKYAEPVVLALEMIQGLTGVGGHAAADALKAIDAILKAISSGAANGATPEAVLSDLAKLQAGVAADDAAADAELTARFPA